MSCDYVDIYMLRWRSNTGFWNPKSDSHTHSRCWKRRAFVRRGSCRRRNNTSFTRPGGIDTGAGRS